MLLLPECLGPGGRNDLGDLAVGHVGQARQDFAQVSIRFDAPAPAAFNDGVEDGAAIPGVGLADEQPVLLAQRRGVSLRAKPARDLRVKTSHL